MGKLLDKPNSDAIVSTLMTCFFLFILIFVCVVRFCAHNKSNTETIIVKNDRRFSRFFVWKV